MEEFSFRGDIRRKRFRKNQAEESVEEFPFDRTKLATRVGYLCVFVVNPVGKGTSYRSLEYLGSFCANIEASSRLSFARKQFTPDQIQDALSYLTEHRYLNDDSYAESFIRDKINRQRWTTTKSSRCFFKKASLQKFPTVLVTELYPVEVQQENAALL